MRIFTLTATLVVGLGCTATTQANHHGPYIPSGWQQFCGYGGYCGGGYGGCYQGGCGDSCHPGCAHPWCHKKWCQDPWWLPLTQQPWDVQICRHKFKVEVGPAPQMFAHVMVGTVLAPKLLLREKLGLSQPAGYPWTPSKWLPPMPGLQYPDQQPGPWYSQWPEDQGMPATNQVPFYWHGR
jgi:hypothetical protein